MHDVSLRKVRSMKSNLFQPYRQPECVIRAVKQDDGATAELEVVTHVHASVLDEECSYEHPSMLRHPMHDALMQNAEQSLSEIEVRVEFAKPEHVLRAKYVMWSPFELGFPVCEGNGRTAQQIDPNTQKITAVKCLGPSRCPLAKHGQNKCMVDARMGAMYGPTPVEIRVNSENGFLALHSGLRYAHAMTSGDLTKAKLKVFAWNKSTRGSGYKAFTTLGVEFKEADETSKSNPHMEAYGAELLSDWESQFPVFTDDLPLPESVEVLFDRPSQKSEILVRETANQNVMFPLPGKPANGDELVLSA